MNAPSVNQVYVLVQKTCGDMKPATRETSYVAAAVSHRQYETPRYAVVPRAIRTVVYCDVHGSRRCFQGRVLSSTRVLLILLILLCYPITIIVFHHPTRSLIATAPLLAGIPFLFSQNIKREKWKDSENAASEWSGELNS